MRYLSLSGGLAIVAFIALIGWGVIEAILWLFSLIHISVG